LLIAFLVALFVNMVSFAGNESITIVTYYPSPYGSYNELHANQFEAKEAKIGALQADQLEANKIVLGGNAFISVNADEGCPEDYEPFATRWEVVTCDSKLKKVAGGGPACTTLKFEWGTSLPPKCSYCISAHKIRGTQDAMICSKTAECVAKKKKYTICVKIPTDNF